jgi:hypothetical protein
VEWFHLAQSPMANSLWRRKGTLGLHKRREISWQTKRLSASEEGLCSMELVKQLAGLKWLELVTRSCELHPYSSALIELVTRSCKLHPYSSALIDKHLLSTCFSRWRYFELISGQKVSSEHSVVKWLLNMSYMQLFVLKEHAS